MTDIRPVLFVVGVLLMALGVAMLLPAAIDIASEDIDWRVFAVSSMVTIFVGGSLVLSMRGADEARLGLREAFLLTVMSWTLVSLFGAIPFLFSNIGVDIADAVFEAVSGITTTGSTVLTGLDQMHRGILLWRSLLQWIGGIGIVVTAIALLPLLQVGGMQLFRAESSDRSEKMFPRLKQVATALVGAYLGLTAICAIGLWTAGMSTFDAVNHAMTTLATGGYSTRDASIGFYRSAVIEGIIVFFMLLGGITFTVHVRVLRTGPAAYFRDEQVRLFIGIVAAATLSIAAWTVLTQDMAIHDALRGALFNVVSIVTTTGYASADYALWGAYPVAAFYFLTFVGGCTGSTAGGMKIFRFQVLYAVAHQQLMQLLAPHRVTVPRVQGKEIESSVAISVLGFFFFYALTFAVIALALSVFGLDPVTALSGAATAIGNVGPGLGPIIGPAGNFAALPDGAKWVLSAGMLLGRLEFVTVFVLLTRAFWKD
ncbi:MAG: TrkH family potassium uptake protein [Alphaproteobacteria bacterium]